MLRLIFLTACILWVVTMPCSTLGASLDLDRTSRNRTARLYQKNDCLTSEQKAYGKEILKGLDYNAQRIFRRFCLLRPLSFSQCQDIWSLLITTRFTYNQTLCFEKWMEPAVNDVEQALRGLKAMRSLSLNSGSAFQALLSLPDMTPEIALHMIGRLTPLSDPALTALTAVSRVENMTIAFVRSRLPLFSSFTTAQALVFAALADIEQMNLVTVTEILPYIAGLDQEICWTAEALFQSRKLSRREARNWLVHFFILPVEAREKHYQQLSREQKELLLSAMRKGNRYLARSINNLHAVTNRYGQELSTGALMQLSPATLHGRLRELPSHIRSQYESRFKQAADSRSTATMVGLLQEATAAARKHLAGELTTARLYMVLTEGENLYDSSFRDILVPILRSRITTLYSGDILQALTRLDPDRHYLSDFIAGNAQKGTLAVFFPADPGRQIQLLECIMQPALDKITNLLDFSVNILPLMESAAPQARTFLISELAGCAQSDHDTAPYCRTTLAYLTRHHHDLLTEKGRMRLSPIANDLQRIDLERFQGTPFVQWKTDRVLHALSLFYPDSDGMLSFLSFTRLLEHNGYTAKPNTLTSGRDLFSSLQNQGNVTTYHKQVNQVEIIHTLSVYAGDQAQQTLLRQFLESGWEILAQRGHSYWREEQLLTPLSAIYERPGEIAIRLPNVKRFVSLGSCGGMKVYSDLTRLLYGNVSIMATTGTGTASVNDAFMVLFPELAAKSTSETGWDEVFEQAAHVFPSRKKQIYVYPGSLPAILHAMQFPVQPAQSESANTTD